MLKFCMQDYKRYGVEEIDHGSYSVKGTTCVEAQINGVVPRVILSAVQFNDVLLKKPKQPLPGAKRGRKRKHEKLPESKPPDIPQEVKLDKPKAKVGRKPNSFKKFVYYESITEEKRFNGDVLPSKRQRKPNSKFFSDYVVPANYNLIDEQDTDDSNYQSDSEFSTSTPIKPPKVIKSSSEIKISSDGKPKVFKPRIKESVLSSVDDDVKVEIHSTVDPLDIQLGDDIVHSFLPMYNPPQVHNYKNNVQKPATTTPTTTSKIKEKKPRSDPILKSKEAPKTTTSSTAGVVTQPITILSSNWKSTDGDPSKLYGKVLCMPVILTTNSQNGVINVNDVSNQSLAILSKPDPRWVQIQPKPPDAPSTPATQIPVSKKPTSQKSNTNSRGTKFVQKNSTPDNNKTKIKLNNSIALKSEKTKPKALSTSKYVLVECDAKYKSAKVSDVDFNKLVRSLKAVKLPSKNWKIRIIVSPQETITEVIFTNKEEPERCVKFLRGVTGYRVTFGKTEVRLLGAPTLQTFEDIATLLEIIHNISLNSHVLEYC